MPKLILDDAFIEVNAVDLSCFSDSVEVTLSKAEIEANTFGCGQDVLQGRETSSFTINFHASFGAAEVDATLYPLWNTGATFNVTVRPVQDDPVSGTNPEYQGTCRLFEYMPISGEEGELSTTSVTFKVIGAMSRVTV
mgnify:CR=1 FL=1